MSRLRKIVVDVDGVLLKSNENTEKLVRLNGFPQFSFLNVKTYDFNKSLPENLRAEVKPLGVDVKEVFKYYNKPETFSTSEANWLAISFIREQAASGSAEFVIHTLSMNAAVNKVKEGLFKQWFGGIPNISYSGVVASADKGKDELVCDAVVEDSLENLRKYAKGTQLMLVSQPYNQAKYNPSCSDVFTNANFGRYPSTEVALAEALVRLGVLDRNAGATTAEIMSKYFACA